MDDPGEDLPIAYTHGALFIGWTITVILYGLTCFQTAVYLRRFLYDRPVLKVTVIVFWVLETAHLILLSYSVYGYLVKSHGRPGALIYPVMTLKVQLVPAALLVGMIQNIWIMRIWKFSRHRWRTPIAYLLLTSVVADWVISLTWLVAIIPIKTFNAVTHHLWHISTSIALITINDILATSYFCYVAHSSRDGLQRTNTLVNKLIIYGINTGLLTVVGTITLLVSVLAVRERLYYIAIYMVVPSIYLNTYLAMLNFRRRSVSDSTVNSREEDDDAAFELTTVPLATLSRYTHFGDM